MKQFRDNSESSMGLENGGEHGLVKANASTPWIIGC